MPWILFALLALVAIALLGLLALRLWGTVKRLSATVGAASERVGQATEVLNGAMASGPLGGSAAGRPDGVFPSSPGVPGTNGPDPVTGA